MKKLYYHIPVERYVGRLDETDKGLFENAEVLRDAKWQPTSPAELLWNATPITEAEAMELMNGQQLTAVA